METIATPSCNTSTLTPFIPSGPNPWDVSKVKHVLRRIGFGGSIDTVDAALALSPNDFIDNLVDNAFNLPPTAAPPWGYWAVSDFNDFPTENPDFIDEWRLQTGHDFISETLRGRLTSFWMNHFVTELETYFYSPYLFQYYNTVQTHNLGNFKDFVHAIGINSTMLLYLNGFENTNVNPNENYARELYELFTLGEGNGYSQNDIIETSRALTGYNHWVENGAQIYFDASTFDAGEKTIFGETGNWGYDDVINILFQERSTEIAEIDIIAQHDDKIIIVEVKTRNPAFFGSPQDFVTPSKIKLLVKASNEYVISNDLELEVRFDIIAILKNKKLEEIEHFENAFYHF